MNPWAFPSPGVVVGGFQQGAYEGMSLRDYFAARAMPMLAAEFYSHRQQLEDGTVPELAAKVAYQFADAMLKERQK